jgi:hypothetical protein
VSAANDPERSKSRRATVVALLDLKPDLLVQTLVEDGVGLVARALGAGCSSVAAGRGGRRFAASSAPLWQPTRATNMSVSAWAVEQPLAAIETIANPASSTAIFAFLILSPPSD